MTQPRSKDLHAALAHACQLAKRHGVRTITPTEFLIRGTESGRTHALFVDGHHVISVMINPAGLATFAMAEMQWKEHDAWRIAAEPLAEPAAADPALRAPARGQCPDCRGDYQLRGDGRLRQHRGLYAGQPRSAGPYKCGGVGKLPVDHATDDPRCGECGGSDPGDNGLCSGCMQVVCVGAEIPTDGGEFEYGDEPDYDRGTDA
jgi:hypothetical protein